MQISIDEQYDKIYRYCYFRLKDADMAEDITQETFLRFFENSGYRDFGKPLAYLYTIARNLCMDEFRRKKPQSLEEVQSYSSGENLEEETVRRIVFDEAMQALAREEQELLLLRYVNEVPMQELSRIYGKSRFALRRDLKKIVQRLEAVCKWADV